MCSPSAGGSVGVTAGVSLNAQNVDNYLWFYTFFTHGAEGPFLVAENDAGFWLPQPKYLDEAGAKTTAEAYKLLQPTACTASSEGPYKRKATIYYSNAIFAADMEVTPDGTVRMTDDRPIAADLPRKVSLNLVVKTQ